MNDGRTEGPDGEGDVSAAADAEALDGGPGRGVGIRVPVGMQAPTRTTSEMPIVASHPSRWVIGACSPVGGNPAGGPKMSTLLSVCPRGTNARSSDRDWGFRRRVVHQATETTDEAHRPSDRPTVR